MFQAKFTLPLLNPPTSHQTIVLGGQGGPSDPTRGHTETVRSHVEFQHPRFDRQPVVEDQQAVANSHHDRVAAGFQVASRFLFYIAQEKFTLKKCTFSIKNLLFSVRVRL